MVQIHPAPHIPISYNGSIGVFEAFGSCSIQLVGTGDYVVAVAYVSVKYVGRVQVPVVTPYGFS